MYQQSKTHRQRTWTELEPVSDAVEGGPEAEKASALISAAMQEEDHAGAHRSANDHDPSN